MCFPLFFLLFFLLQQMKSHQRPQLSGSRDGNSTLFLLQRISYPCRRAWLGLSKLGYELINLTDAVRSASQPRQRTLSPPSFFDASFSSPCLAAPPPSCYHAGGETCYRAFWSIDGLGARSFLVQNGRTICKVPLNCPSTFPSLVPVPGQQCLLRLLPPPLWRMFLLHRLL